MGPGGLLARHFNIQAKNKCFGLNSKNSVYPTHTQAKKPGPLAWVNGEPTTCFGPSRHTGQVSAVNSHGECKIIRLNSRFLSWQNYQAMPHLFTQETSSDLAGMVVVGFRKSGDS